MPSSRRLLPSLLLVLTLAPACECDRDTEPTEPTAEPAAGGEGEPSEGEEEGSGEAPAARREPGPLGRTLAVFDDATVTTRLLVLRRTGPAEGEAPADAAAIGAAWIGGVELQLARVSEDEASGRTATLFGPVGACEARVLRELHLRGTPDEGAATLFDALEVAPCEGTSTESIETTHPFGVEGEVVVEELSSRTMSAPAEDVAAAVAEVEREAGDGEEMDLQARAVGETGVTVVSGWSTHVVRGGTLLESFEDGIAAYVTVGARTLLVARMGREVRLLAVGEGALERVAIETAE